MSRALERLCDELLVCSLDLATNLIWRPGLHLLAGNVYIELWEQNEGWIDSVGGEINSGILVFYLHS
ncbi:hypothetical protein PR202_ga05785 [Eleusine coracana subsp. coracana]|uniref:Uncharacterized protein n=1 Tax=Eleusine coracana subsp. coracana TaxID=191504 RepID=A0AAV5BTB5_ELECO|nr:hypothetical protein PR202_ga05785 [Eleusine coracana subsp. coracana]